MLFLCGLKKKKKSLCGCLRAPSRGKLSWKILASIPVRRHAVETLPTVSIADNAVQQMKEAKPAVVADHIFCLAVRPSHVEAYWLGMGANIGWYLGRGGGFL